MEQERLDDLLRLAEQHARRVLFELREPVMPVWLLIDAKGAIGILGTPWKNDFEKEAGKIFMRMQMRIRRTIAYSVVFEAWAARATQEEVDSGKHPPASERPDRREIVLALASDGKNHRWRCWDMRRNHLEQVIALEPAQPTMNDEKIETWMTTLLKP